MKYKKLLIVLTAVTALGIAGCGKSSKETAEVTPTPVPTATEADRCKDQYCKICLSYQQHEGRDP